MNVFPSLALWTLDYLTSRPQFVRLSHSITSDVILTDTGAPQGTVLSPFLFSIYTSDCKASHTNCTIDKYADDTVLTGMVTHDEDIFFAQEIVSFVDWCDKNFLELNVTKTKEMVIDFRTKGNKPNPVQIKETNVERVASFKYLGVVLDNTLSWTKNIDNIVNKVKPRMYCLRKLKSFNVDNKLLQMFYSSVVCGALTFGLTCWGGNISIQDRSRLDKMIKKAGGVIGKKQDNLDTMCTHRTEIKMKNILKDETHPLRDEYTSRLNRRSGRYRAPKTKTNRHSNSFIPRSIRIFNESFKRKLENE